MKSGSEDGTLTVIKAGSKAHDLLKAAVEDEGRRAYSVKYNELAHTYNKAEPDDYVVVPETFTQAIANLVKVFDNRGLIRDKDYTIFKIVKDKNGATLPPDERKLVMHKLSTTFMRVV